MINHRPIRDASLLSFLLLSSIAFAASAAQAPPTTRPIRVAIYTDGGSSDKSFINVSHCLSLAADQFKYSAITAAEIREGKLKDFDVLVQPGGSGSGQAKALQPEGCAAIKTFVKDGGGYVGICAGAYLASSDYTWSLHILNAKVLDRAHWARCYGPVQMRLSSDAMKRFGVDKEVVTVDYHQGPLLAPCSDADPPAYQPLATFETEIAKNGAPPGIMKGSTAIASSIFGAGHVICISPHPERSEGLDGLVRRAVAWCSGSSASPTAAGK